MQTSRFHYLDPRPEFRLFAREAAVELHDRSAFLEVLALGLAQVTRLPCGLAHFALSDLPGNGGTFTCP